MAKKYNAKKIKINDINSTGRPSTVAFFSVIVLLSFLVCFSAVRAGSLTPSSTPAATMYTLQDIYTRLTTNAVAGSHSLGPSTSPAGTMYTLTQIYGAIPVIDASKVKLNTSYLGVDGTLVPSGGNATTAQVCSGQTFYGDSQTNWTLATGALSPDASKMLDTATYCGTTGSITSGSNVTVTSSTPTSIPTGYYSGNTCSAALIGGTGIAAANAQVLSGYYAYTSNGTALTGSATAGYAYGDSSAANVLTTAAGNGGASSYNATNLTTSTVKNGVAFGVGLTGAYTGALTWNTTAGFTLCWDANQGCTNGNGAVYNSGNTVLLGAVEYCKYLMSNGSTIAATQQDIWRLPTESELLASLSDQFIISPPTQTGFASTPVIGQVRPMIAVMPGSPSTTTASSIATMPIRAIRIMSGVSTSIQKITLLNI